MPLCLVLHDLPPGGTEVLEAAVWELSESHSMFGCGMLVDTSVSAGYLLSHLRGALIRAGLAGRLIIAPATSQLRSWGVEPEVEAWIAESLCETAE
ncbi:hypothetical protein [Muricoccus pecuniae]|uniref:Uncharacterized protein n=1 Tax=Muricoccus pecuniae TaxID=693023 RepID=A0A840YD17_9PROT|nr:hypothetical protein [Roseomonas pecuniae]MBB5694011.1 hypothetical protein [Roseomonas pecuniae]